MMATTGLRVILATTQKLTHVTSALMPHVRLAVERKGAPLTVDGTNGDVWARATFAGGERSGVVYVARAALLDALRTIKPRVATDDLMVTLAHDGKDAPLTVTVDGRTVKVASAPGAPQRFPDTIGYVSTLGSEHFISGALGETSDLIRAVAMAAGTDDTIPFLCRVRITADGADKIVMRATDRYRAHWGTFANMYGATFKGASIARDAIASAVDILDGLVDDSANLDLYSTGTRVVWRAGHIEVVMENEPNSDFPKIDALKPSITTGCAIDTLDGFDGASEIVKALRSEKQSTLRVALVDIERDGRVRFLTEDGASVDHVVELDAMEDTVTLADAQTVCVNSEYLRDALAGVRGAVAALAMTESASELKRMLVIHGDDFYGLIMGVRKDNMDAVLARVGRKSAPRKKASAAKPAATRTASTGPRRDKPASKPTTPARSRRATAAANAFAGADIDKINTDRAARTKR